MKLPATGSCQCGSVTYEVTEPPVLTAACHCTECQKASGAAFSISMILRTSGFAITGGELTRWDRPTDQGGVAQCWFCPTCGNRIYHDNPAFPGMLRLKPGTLDDTSVIDPAVHVWTCREQPWLSRFAEIHREDTQPDVRAAMASLAEGKSPF